MLHTKNSIRVVERSSIRRFMEENRKFLCGRVLDFGAGDQPYRDLVEGEYVPYDPLYSSSAPAGAFDAVMCNQVIQYLPDPPNAIVRLASHLTESGTLLLTYPTHWEEVEESDLWRFTKAGMTRLLMSSFEVVKHERRAQIEFADFNLVIGYGFIGRRR